MSAPAPQPDFAPATTPAAPFVAPLILRTTSRRRGKVLRDIVLTALVWCGWLYLLVAAAGVFWIPPYVHRLLPVSAPDSPWPTIEVVVACAVIALLGTVFVASRAMRDRRRFGGVDRRRAAADPTDAELAAALQAEALDPAMMRGARRIVLYHDAQGRPERAEFGFAASRRRSA